MSNFFYHLKGLLKKNFILWKRDRRGTLCELLVPIFFIGVLVAISYSIPTDDIEAKDFINDLSILYPDYDSSLTVIKNCKNPDFGGKVALVPDIGITRKLKTILESYPENLEVVFFPNKEAFDKHISQEGYIYKFPPQICFGVVFTEWQNGNYNYQISYNLTLSTEVPYEVISKLYMKEQDSLWKDYISSGFTPIVNYVSNIILQEESGDPNKKITVKTAPLKRDAYTKTNTAEGLGQNMSFYLVLPMIATFLRMTSRILSEKEKKIKEGMMMMGLGRASFYSSWILTYLIFYLLLSLIISVILKVSAFSYTDFFIIFIFHFLFCIALLTQSLFITVFFTQQRPGIMTATVIFLLQFIFLLFALNSPEPTSSEYQTASIFPHSAVGIGARLFALYQNKQKDFTFSMVTEIMGEQKITYSFNSCIISSVICLVLFLYLDQVFPNEFGQKKHFLFFLGFKNSAVIKNHEEYARQRSQIQEEEVDEEKRKQESENKILEIQQLQKIFKSDGQTRVAVENLNLKMYEGQIFAFLGHNGAGKTTTLSILTGMIAPTSGTAYIKGFNILQQMDSIRHILGVCPQHDILFDQLTVQEHLELFATLKGMPQNEQEQAIKKIIKDIDLVDKTNILSSSLSGGQKRKLSVAIAFIGGSEVIILDEPTSGMDVSARRHIWDMLKNYKSSKIIILTTHFMDEADFLGDRIGIISEGKIKCVGSNVFLKENYGNGYTFTFVKKENTSSSEGIIKLISKMAPESEVISDVSAEIAFQVPKKYISTFKDIFA